MELNHVCTIIWAITTLYCNTLETLLGWLGYHLSIFCVILMHMSPTYWWATHVMSHATSWVTGARVHVCRRVVKSHID